MTFSCNLFVLSKLMSASRLMRRLSLIKQTIMKTFLVLMKALSLIEKNALMTMRLDEIFSKKLASWKIFLLKLT